MIGILAARPKAPADREATAVETALAQAERNGFRLAVLGWTAAVVAIGLFYVATLPNPGNLVVAAVTVALGAIGLGPLVLSGRSGERTARHAFFAFQVVVVTSLIVFGPISSAGGIPQNFVFLSSRHQYYYLVIAASVLTLSPGLVLWTGLWAIAGLGAATAWIAAAMDRVVSYADLPLAPSREQYLAVVHDLHFLNVPARFNEALVIAITTAIAALAVRRARDVVRSHAAVEQRRSRVQQLLRRYVPAPVAEQLVVTGQLAPHQREATILFADIEGFTHLSERLSPREVVGVLNAFFGDAGAVVEQRGGTVVNYIGDALIAAFNAPLPLANHAGQAVEAARALQALASERTFEGCRLRLRIGVATGPVAAGTVGGANHQSYTVYGDTVNVAQRLERLNKELGTLILLSQETYAAASPACLDAVPMGEMEVRGRAARTAVYAIKGFAKEKDIMGKSATRRALLVGTAGAAGAATLAPALPAVAHHGWSSFDTRHAWYVRGTLTRVRWGYPHSGAALQLESADLPADWQQRTLPPGANERDGRLTMASARRYAGAHKQLDLVLAGPDWMERWGLKRPLRVGEKIEAVGFLSTGDGDDLRPVMFWLADGQGVWQQLTAFPQQPAPAR